MNAKRKSRRIREEELSAALVIIRAYMMGKATRKEAIAAQKTIDAFVRGLEAEVKAVSRRLRLKGDRGKAIPRRLKGGM